MRERLADIFVELVEKDSRYIVLSGDHGYALFDPIRKHHPDRFINVGVAEQALVGYASGLAAVGMKPIIYGLAAFVPMRVLEQLRLDLCFPNSNVLIFGDGAGLVYSTLGTSHQCTEDIAVTRVLPNMKVYSPCDQFELEDCINEATQQTGPSYIRIGKSDRPATHSQLSHHTNPQYTNREIDSTTALISTGSFSHPAKTIAKELKVNSVSIPKINPLPTELVDILNKNDRLIFIEEHNRNGGLYSACLEFMAEHQLLKNKNLHSIAIENKFNKKCGSYQYALSEHDLTDDSLFKRVREYIGHQ